MKLCNPKIKWTILLTVFNSKFNSKFVFFWAAAYNSLHVGYFSLDVPCACMVPSLVWPFSLSLHLIMTPLIEHGTLLYCNNQHNNNSHNTERRKSLSVGLWAISGPRSRNGMRSSAETESRNRMYILEMRWHDYPGHCSLARAPAWIR